MAVANWIEAVEPPAATAAADLRAFFGIPPDAEEHLDRNISKKRRHWRSKTRESVASEKAKRKVEQALKVIAAIEQHLKRGVVDEIDLEQLREEIVADPDMHVAELEDLWRVLEELLASGRLYDALRLSREARDRFAGAGTANAAFGWLAAMSSRLDETTAGALRREGVEALQAAIAAGEGSHDVYMWKTILQLDLDEPAAALATVNDADEAVDGPLPPWLHSHRCEAHAALGQADGAIQDALQAIRPDTDDLALRSNTVTALIVAARNAYLPITSKEALRKYQDLVEFASWCAVGAPEAEDRVRPYWLWAVGAESRAYVGRIELRSILAVGSGFLMLPLLNRWRSRPHWRVLLDGPDRTSEEMFQLVAYSGIPLIVHDGLSHKLPWTAH
jgi:hypothetical protein